MELDQSEYYIGVGVILFATFISGDFFSSYCRESDLNTNVLLGKPNLE